MSATDISDFPAISGTEPSRNPLDTIRTAAAVKLAPFLGLSAEQVYPCVETARNGPQDFSLAIPRLRLQGRPDKIAQGVAGKFEADEYVERVEASGPFLSIFARTSTLIKSVLETVHRLSREGSGGYGTNTLGQGKKIVVEFSSPNVAKPFHAGHMRSTIIGTFLANIYEASGWEVVRLNYLGDWGTQYGLLAIGFEKYGSEDELQRDAIMHLFHVYVSINKDVKAEEAENRSDTKDRAKDYFKHLEDGDQSAVKVWRRFRDLSIVEYIEIYKRLNVAFDVYGGESLVGSDAIAEVMEELKHKGLLTGKTREESATSWKSPKAEQGTGETAHAEAQDATVESPPGEAQELALAVDLNRFKLGKPVLQKPDGSTIYMVRDIAGAIERYAKYKFDKMIYVVGDQQDFHFAQCFKILELMGVPFADRLEHVNFGRVKGMSTRSGDVVFLTEILDVAKKTMLTQMKATPDRFSAIEDPEFTSDQIGMTAVKVQDMQGKRIMAYTFDWNRMTSFEGDTGPYLQYAHVRLCSIQRKAGITLKTPEEIDTSLLGEPKARDIVFHLAGFPDVVQSALKSHEPSTIVHYCFKLAHLISSAWETLVVKGQEDELAQARLYLFTCAKEVLGSAMRMLSLTPLEHM